MCGITWSWKFIYWGFFLGDKFALHLIFLLSKRNNWDTEVLSFVISLSSGHSYVVEMFYMYWFEEERTCDVALD